MSGVMSAMRRLAILVATQRQAYQDALGRTGNNLSTCIPAVDDFPLLGYAPNVLVGKANLLCNRSEETHILLGHFPAHHVELDGILVDIRVANHERHLDCLYQAWDVGDFAVSLFVRPGERFVHLRRRYYHDNLSRSGSRKSVRSTEGLWELDIALTCDLSGADDRRRDGSTPGESPWCCCVERQRQRAVAMIGLRQLGPLGVNHLSTPRTPISCREATSSRLLRYLAAIEAVEERDRGEYTANQTTRNLTEKVVEAGISHYFGLTAPQYQCLPDLLKRTGYQTPVDDANTAFHLAFRTTLDPFSWFAQNPTYLADFHAYHALRRQPDATWLSVYPVETETAGWPADQPLYVNVGGGVGHQCAQFKEKHPNLDGRVILQDLPHSVAEALPTPGVEIMAYNMFEPQPVIGVKFYHLLAVLHNHPRHKVRMLLKTIKAAMKPESVLLIDEMVFLEENVNYMAASVDMTILAAFANMERTEAQWATLFKDVGLRIVRILL
ncbi:S-adenosyl-L-methionine-dependent methyltransferase [Daldinia decipiens]|uniref:S-adenosyl-L-methionine-dependent methyltransferase n=1 Tax=Daldinia decipiens TaxID=326647 RepID=UPI0020C2ECB7|nr:S-adenosyl-L-methionine-dependent methyltransferase [Daldinia decipiens]KAI1655087.1 S-adenosyl-L-methionine-dependent methyltransferase [Daldinia decipiens]